MRATLLLSICIAILAVAQASGATSYVDASVSSSGDGKSPATAFKKIQEGIDTSSHGDTVTVAEGVYVENIQFKGKNIVLRTTDPTDPSVVQNTIIDGNRAGSVVHADLARDVLHAPQRAAQEPARSWLVCKGRGPAKGALVTPHLIAEGVLRRRGSMGAKHGTRASVAGATLALLLTWSACPEWVYVARVIDGDTFVIADGTRARVRDIDTPETKHPRKGREPGGVAATELARSLLEGKEVWLQGTTKDRYGRRLAAVQLRGGTMYADIVRLHGYDKLSGTIARSPAGSSEQTGSAGARGASSSSPPPAYRPGSPGSGVGKVYVRAYYRKDGTYVRSHYRRRPSRR